jgi:hypothetical protein
MRIILFVILIISSAFAMAQKPPEQLWYYLNYIRIDSSLIIKNNIRSVTAYLVGTPDTTKYAAYVEKNMYMEFDRNGDPVMMAAFEREKWSTIPIDKILYKYNSKGQLIEKKQWSDSKGIGEDDKYSLNEWLKYEYNEKGLHTKIEGFYHNGMWKSRTLYSYDKDGKRTGVKRLVNKPKNGEYFPDEDTKEYIVTDETKRYTFDSKWEETGVALDTMNNFIFTAKFIDEADGSSRLLHKRNDTTYSEVVYNPDRLIVKLMESDMHSKITPEEFYTIKYDEKKNVTQYKYERVGHYPETKIIDYTNIYENGILSKRKMKVTTTKKSPYDDDDDAKHSELIIRYLYEYY